MERIAFLNGTLGFQDAGHRKYFMKMNSEGKHVMVIDNLFSQPEKMLELKYYPTWVIGTTGFEAAKVGVLIEKFYAIGYVPKNVIFGPSEDPFIGVAFRFKNSINFYLLDYETLTTKRIDYLIDK